MRKLLCIGLILLLASQLGFAQSQKSFTGTSAIGRVEACDQAKKMAEMFNYPKTGACQCERNNVGWTCQVDGSK